MPVQNFGCGTSARCRGGAAHLGASGPRPSSRSIRRSFQRGRTARLSTPCFIPRTRRWALERDQRRAIPILQPRPAGNLHENIAIVSLPPGIDGLQQEIDARSALAKRPVFSPVSGNYETAICKPVESVNTHMSLRKERCRALTPSTRRYEQFTNTRL